jgi:hypothetical protein
VVLLGFHPAVHVNTFYLDLNVELAHRLLHKVVGRVAVWTALKGQNPDCHEKNLLLSDDLGEDPVSVADQK